VNLVLAPKIHKAERASLSVGRMADASHSTQADNITPSDPYLRRGTMEWTLNQVQNSAYAAAGLRSLP